MALPTVSKTWVKTFNTVLNVSSDLNRTQELLFDLKTKMVAAGWVVTSSCNQTTFKNFGDASPDTWATSADIHLASSGARSWIVLENSVLSLSFLLDCQSSSDYHCDFVISPGFGSANGGTDGSLTSRPTGTLERIFLDSSTAIGGQGGSTRIVTHAWHTADKEQFRFWARSNGTDKGSVFIMFCKPDNTPDLWTDPVIFMFMTKRSEGLNPIASDYYTVARVRTFIGGNIYNMVLSAETCFSGDVPMTLFSGMNPSELSSDNGYLLQPTGLVGLESGVRGSNGRVPDFWWGPNEMNQGDTLPDNGTRQFVKLGDAVFVWDGSVPLVE